MSEEISVKGLDEFGAKFLTSADTTNGEIHVTQGADAPTEKMLAAYLDQQKQDFIQRTGSFTEDIIAFIVEQKGMRALDDKSVVFAIALANINLRNSFCAPQNKGEEKNFTPTRKNELGETWDEICYAAQNYYDENA